MSDAGRDRAAGVPGLSHGEAETLISARLDAPLDPEQNRRLLAHLATCASCRAFSDQMAAMTTGLRGLPQLPASPTVSRQVRERLAEDPPFWAGVGRIFVNGRWGAMPAAASLLLFVAAAALFVVLRGDGQSGNTIVAPTQTDFATAAGSPTATPTLTIAATEAEIADPTRTPRPTRTATPRPALDVNIQVTVTPTTEPADTATAAPTETATATPSPTGEPTETPRPTEPATATPDPTQTPAPTAAPTEAPTETPTVTPTAPPPTERPPDEPTVTPEPTATATATPEPTNTPAPTERPTDEPSPEPMETPTTEPTERPTRTPTSEPTATPEPTEEPTEEPTAAPTETETPTATATRRPRRTRTPTEEAVPAGQPTIAPANPGQGGPIEEPEEDPEDDPEDQPIDVPEDEPAEDPTTEIVPSDEPSETPEPVNEPTATSEPRIVSIDETPESESPTGEAGDETETPEPDEETPEPEDEPGPLDAAAVLGEFGGAAAPAGGLAVPANGGLVVVADGGGLAVADQSGGTVAPLGAAADPIWSPLGGVLLFADLNNGQRVGAWARDTGETFAVGAAGEGEYADYPAGWIESSIYYLRVFEDGRAEVHRTGPVGENDELVWSSAEIAFVGERPVTRFDGVLVPTGSSWLLVGADGSEADLGGNPYGAIANPQLSPFGSLLAYAAGGDLVIAAVDAPGAALLTLPYDGVSGFDFSPDGQQIVVSDGVALTIYGTGDGVAVGTAAAASPAVGPSWAEDGIRYLELGETATLRLVQPSAFA